MYFKETKIFNEKEAKKITDYKIVDVNEKCAIVQDENSGLYDVVKNYDEGYQLIRDAEGRYGVIDKKGDIIFPTKIDVGSTLSSGADYESIKEYVIANRLIYMAESILESAKESNSNSKEIVKKFDKYVENFEKVNEQIAKLIFGLYGKNLDEIYTVKGADGKKTFIDINGNAVEYKLVPPYSDYLSNEMGYQSYVVSDESEEKKGLMLNGVKLFEIIGQKVYVGKDVFNIDQTYDIARAAVELCNSKFGVSNTLKEDFVLDMMGRYARFLRYIVSDYPGFNNSDNEKGSFRK